MLKERVMEYYLNQDYNCAESIIRAANDKYGLGLQEEAIHALGGFGSGCCAGRLCGTCAAGVAAISAKYIHTRLHADEQAREKVSRFMEAFIKYMGSDLCEDLKKKFWKEELEAGRCRRTVELAADFLELEMEQFMAEDLENKQRENADIQEPRESEVNS